MELNRRSLIRAGMITSEATPRNTGDGILAFLHRGVRKGHNIRDPDRREAPDVREDVHEGVGQGHEHEAALPEIAQVAPHQARSAGRFFPGRRRRLGVELGANCGVLLFC